MFKELVPFLSQHLNSLENRSTLLDLAFYEVPEIKAKIDLEGSPVAFATRLINVLRTHGESTPSTQALWQFLLTLGEQLGEDQKSFIDRFKPWANTPNSAEQPVFLPHFMVEPLPDSYINRPQSLEPIVDKLVAASKLPGGNTITLRGPGGYGKTTLALAACHDPRVRKAFLGGILWVTLGENARNEDLTGKILDLIVILTEERPPVIRLEAARDRLKRAIANQSILLVLDDVWLERWHTLFADLGQHIVILITTRNITIRPARMPAYTIDAMAPHEAIALLSFDLAYTVTEIGMLQHLAARLGHWPLLLKLANAQLKRYVNLGASLLASLGAVNSALDTQGFIALDDQHDRESRNRAAAASLAVSLALLDDKQRMRFEYLAIFPEDADIPLETLEKLWKLSDIVILQLISQLASLSLLFKVDLATKHIRLHDVIRTYLRKLFEDRLASWNAGFLQAYNLNAWKDLALDEPYMWFGLAYHLREAGQLEILRALLLDIVFLQIKLDVTHVNALLQDYIFAEIDLTLSLIESAVLMSKHVLTDNKKALAHQLVGRLMSHYKYNSEIRDFIDRVLIPGLYPLALESKAYVLNQAGGALLQTLPGHKDDINHIAVTEKGRAISASSDHTLIVWALRNDKDMFKDNRRQTISALLSSEYEQLIATGATIGKALHMLYGHKQGVNYAIFIDDKRAISASDDNTLMIWNIDTGRIIRSLRGHLRGVNHMALTSDGRVVSASDDHTLIVWSINTGQPLQILKGHTNSVTHVIMTREGYAISASDDNTLIVWNIDTGQPLQILKGHTNSVTHVIMTRKGYAISASDDNTLIVWNIDTGQPLQILKGHTKAVTHVVITNDQRAISASDDHSLIVWNIDTGQIMCSMHGHTSPVKHIILTPDRQAISASDDHTLMIWNIETGQLLHTLRGHTRGINHIALMSRYRAVSASNDGTLIVWNIATHPPEAQDSLKTLLSLEGSEVQAHRQGINHIAVTNDGRAISASDDHTLIVWDAATGTPLRVLEGHTSNVIYVALLGDDRAISASDDHTLIIWDLNSATPLHILIGHEKWVAHVTITDDGRAVSASWDQTLIVWDLESGTPLLPLVGHTRGVNQVVLASQNRVVSGDSDGTLIVWNIDTGEILHTLRGHSNHITHVVIADKQHVVSTAYDTIFVWDIDQGQRVGQFKNDLPGREALMQAFPGVSSLEGFERHASGYGLSWTTNPLTISAADGTSIATFYSDGTITSAAWLPDGKSIVAGDDTGRMLFLRWIR